jgi:glycosyltransferase involved in cell wall biosynthesis
MKILFCDNRLGGLLGFRIDIIKHFVDEGHEVCLIVPPARTDWDKVGAKLASGVRTIEVNMQPSGLNPLQDIHLFLQYINIFKKEKPDIVFNYTIKPNIYSSIAAKLCGSHVVCMLAGLGYMFEGRGLLKYLGLKLYKHGLSKADKVFVLNQMNYDKIVSSKMVGGDKLILLKGGEGVNLEDYAFQPADYADGILFLMVSRVLYDKGYGEFIEAARELKGKYQNVDFEILGPLAYDSPMGVPPEVFERDKGKGVFHYLGVVPNVSSFVSRKNTVIVLPSKYGEGLNRSLMEACAIGRPIITTDIPGCRETVDNKKNGYLIPMNDSKALVSAMESFIKLSPEEKVQMASYSHQLAVSRFNIEDVIRMYDDIVNFYHS